MDDFPAQPLRSPWEPTYSHQGTPAQECAPFGWSSPPLDMQHHHHRPHPSLQPLVTIPQWPSMLNGYFPPNAGAAPGGQPLMTPVSAISGRSASTPRRTLTDDERKKMCEYHERNPTTKQTEIGALFGVERSTVSKVLRQKEKYLNLRAPERSAGETSPKGRGRLPDIERALSTWVHNQRKRGHKITDEALRNKAYSFSTVSGDGNPANSNVWLEKFKRRHNMSVSSRVSSDEPESVVVEAMSPQSMFFSSPSLGGSEEQPHFLPKSGSMASLQSAFADQQQMCPPESPFYHSAVPPFPVRHDTMNPADAFYMSPPISDDTTPTTFAPPASLGSMVSEPPSFHAGSAQSVGSSNGPSPTDSGLDEDKEVAIAKLRSRAQSDAPAPTREDANIALQVIARYFQSQSVQSFEDNMLMGRLIEKLR